MLLAVGDLLLIVLIGQLGLAVRQYRREGPTARTARTVRRGVSLPFLGLLVFGVSRSYRDNVSGRDPSKASKRPSQTAIVYFYV